MRKKSLGSRGRDHYQVLAREQRQRERWLQNWLERSGQNGSVVMGNWRGGAELRSLRHWRAGWCSARGSWSATPSCLSRAYGVSLNLPCISPAGKKGQTTSEKVTAKNPCDLECINDIKEVFVKEMWHIWFPQRTTRSKHTSLAMLWASFMVL